MLHPELELLHIPSVSLRAGILLFGGLYFILLSILQMLMSNGKLLFKNYPHLKL